MTPIGGATTPSTASLAWFPVVGGLLGLALGGIWWGATRIWPPAVVAAVVLTADLGLTGMLHLDGLADAADGLLPPLDPGRRLEVMADPRTGAFGVGAVVVVLLVRWVSLAALAPAPLLLAGLWCGSRTMMAAATGLLPYARETGLASAFREPGAVDGGDGSGAPGHGRSGDTWGPQEASSVTRSGGVLHRRRPLAAAVVGLAGAGAMAALPAGLGGRGLAGGVGVVALVAGAGGELAFGVRRLGGFTGDVVGAAGLVGETAGLLVAAARW